MRSQQRNSLQALLSAHMINFDEVLRFSKIAVAPAMVEFTNRSFEHVFFDFFSQSNKAQKTENKHPRAVCQNKQQHAMPVCVRAYK